MSLTDIVLMPGADYQAICDAVRAMTGWTALLKSGELAAAIRGISGGEGLGKLLYRFGVLADAHVPVSDGANDLRRAVAALQDEGVSHIVIAGDLGMYRSNAETELQQYRAAVADATVPIYATNGNHDVYASDANGETLWQTYVGHSLRHVFQQNNDVFILLGMDNGGNEPYTEDTLEWLENQLILYKGRRIAIISHFPLPGYAGLKPGGYYGYSAASNGDDRILSAMTKTGNVILFTGHTHYMAQVEEQYNGIMCQMWHNSDCAAIHTPSVTRPRDAGDVTELTPPDRYQENASQGLVVEAYERGLIVRVMDFVAGAYLDGYEYVLPIHNAATDANNLPVLSTTSITVSEGGSGTFDVSLLLPPAEAVTVTVTVENAAVSVDKAELVFTAEDYNTPQTVTVTALEDDETVDTYCTISVSGDGMAQQIVNVTIDNNDITAYAVIVAARNCTLSNTASTVPIGGSYSTDIVAADGYDRPAVRVTMGGTDITATAYADGLISIAEVTGDVAITAVAFDLTANLIPQSVELDLTPYNNGVGFKNDTRVGSNGSEASRAEMISTGFMPVTAEDTIYVQDWTMLQASGLDGMYFYDVDMKFLGRAYMSVLAENADGTNIDFTDPSAVKIAISACGVGDMAESTLPSVAWLRMCAAEATDPVVSLVAL